MDFSDLQRALPFFGLMAQDQRARPFLTKLMEQSAAGIFVAAITLYTNDKLQDKEAERLRDRIIAIEMDRIIRKQDLDKGLVLMRQEMREESTKINAKIDRIIERGFKK